MKMDNVLVKLYVPMLEEIYDVWIPSHKRIYNVIILLLKAINELNNNCYRPNEMPMLYDKLTAEIYDVNLKVKETTIRSGTELILL
ncbi:MAG: hypothetical protein J6A29_00660 [Clostridia bacterium]|nr:hypothetical protein [Clostridia bacterium]